MDDNQEEFYCCREQEGMDDWVAVRTEQARAQQEVVRARVKETVRVQQLRTQQAEAEVEFQQSIWSSIQQSKDILDTKIALIRRLIVRVFEKKTTTRK